MASHGAEARGMGKRAEAVGQQAKAIVTVAREAGADLPRNAQGLAASGVARGVDPASLFAARVEEPDPVGEPVAAEPPPIVVAEPEAQTEESAETAQAEPVLIAKDPVVSEDPSVALLIAEMSEAEESS